MSLLVEKIAYLCIQSFRFQTKQTSSMISNRRAFHDKYLKNQDFSRYRAGLIVNIAVRVPRPGTYNVQRTKRIINKNMYCMLAVNYVQVLSNYFVYCM